MRTKHDVIMHHYQVVSPFNIIDTTTGKWSGKRRFSARDTMENPHISFGDAPMDLDLYLMEEQLHPNIPSIPFNLFETPPYPLYTGGICHNVLKLS